MIRRQGAAGAALLTLALAGCTAATSGPAAAPTSAASTAAPTVLTVFAAASLTDAFGTIAHDFEDAHPGVTVVVDAGGSSGLAAQLVAGAPADVFAAASPATMATVEKAGLVAGRPVVFARNRLELAVPPGNPAKVTGLADLTRPALAVALCDPVVPCGAAAAAAFRKAGLVAAPDTLEQDVKAVLTKVELGEADAGLVYRTDVLAAGGKVETVPSPEAEAAVTEYPIAALSGSKSTAARAFVNWVLGKGEPVLAKAGFAAP